MTKPTIAFIGSSVVDILMHIPHLPKQQEDINIITQRYALGGCAFNAAWMCHIHDVNHILFSPVGTGLYGDFVKAEMKRKQLPASVLQSEEENGSCCCLIDAFGERSFLSYHGAEYTFKKEWFQILDELPIETVYICGLEIEEESGMYIIEYLERHPELTIYFACGPRILHIDKDKMRRIFALSPILHINEEEACAYTKYDDVKQASTILYRMTKATVIITLGAMGCAYYDGTYHIIKSTPVTQVDTTGAGDSHIGSIIAFQALGFTLAESIDKANRVASFVVTKSGATLTKEEYEQIR